MTDLTDVDGNVCSCARAGATGLDELDHLINVEGMDPFEACRELWGGHFGNGSLDRQLAWARDRGREIVREGLASVLAQLEARGVHA